MEWRKKGRKKVCGGGEGVPGLGDDWLVAAVPPVPGVVPALPLPAVPPILIFFSVSILGSQVPDTFNVVRAAGANVTYRFYSDCTHIKLDQISPGMLIDSVAYLMHKKSPALIKTQK